MINSKESLTYLKIHTLKPLLFVIKSL